MLGIGLVNCCEAFKKLEPTTSEIMASAKKRYFIFRKQNDKYIVW